MHGKMESVKLCYVIILVSFNPRRVLQVSSEGDEGVGKLGEYFLGGLI